MSEENQNIVNDIVFAEEMPKKYDWEFLYTSIMNALEAKDLRIKELTGTVTAQEKVIDKIAQERDALQVNLNWFNVEEFKKMEDDLAEAKKQISKLAHDLSHAVKENLTSKSRLSLMQDLLQEMKDNDKVMNWTATSWREIYLERIITILSSVAVDDSTFKKVLDKTMTDCHEILKRPEMDDEKPAGAVEQKP